MEVVITNLGSTSPDEDVFITGANVDLKAGTSMTWSGVLISDLDAHVTLKQLVLDGKVSVDVTDDAADDAATLATGSMSPRGLPKYAYADLPTGYEGRMAFVTDGRKVGEGGGSGTGCPAYYSDSAWRALATDVAVAT